MRLTIVFVLTVMGVVVLLAEAKPTDPVTTDDIIEEVADRLQQQASPNDFRLDSTPEINAAINATAEDIIEEVADRLQQQASPNDFRSEAVNKETVAEVIEEV